MTRSKQLNHIIAKAKQDVEKDPEHIAICFDLQKLLPPPILTCSKVYITSENCGLTYSAPTTCTHELPVFSCGMRLSPQEGAKR